MNGRTGEGSLYSLIKKRRRAIQRLAKKHGAARVRLFGSAARGEDTPGSDADFLVSMGKGRSLLDLISLSQDLQELLGRRVDVVTDRGLSPYLKENIIREARFL